MRAMTELPVGSRNVGHTKSFIDEKARQNLSVILLGLPPFVASSSFDVGDWIDESSSLETVEVAALQPR